MALDFSAQARLARLTAQGKWDTTYAKTLKKQVESQTPVSTTPTPTPTPTRTREEISASNKAQLASNQAQRVTQAVANDPENTFNATWNAYLEAQKQAYGIETQRGLDKYAQQQTDLGTQKDRSIQWLDWQAQDLARKNARDQADYAKFTSREQSEFNKTLSTRNKDFASAMSNATKAYGQRGILRSWVALKKAWENTGMFADDTKYLKLQEQQKLDDAALNMERIQQDYATGNERIQTWKNQALDTYNTNIGRIGQEVTNFKSDQWAKTTIGLNQLQTQGDQIFNQAQFMNYQLQQDQNKQNALNKLYGNKAQPVRLKLRTGGNYSY